MLQRSHRRLQDGGPEQKHFSQSAVGHLGQVRFVRGALTEARPLLAEQGRPLEALSRVRQVPRGAGPLQQTQLLLFASHLLRRRRRRQQPCKNYFQLSWIN